MKISLFDYNSVKHEVEIPDNTQEISGIILSGDMVMLKPFLYDTGNGRIQDLYDGTFTIKKDKLKSTNHCKTVDECLDLDDLFEE